MNDNWSSYVARLPRPGHERRPEGVSAAGVFNITANPIERRLQPAGPARQRDDQRVQVRLQRRAEHRSAPTTARRLREHHHQPERLGRQHRHRRTGRDVRARRSRAAWSASTAPATAAARPTIPYSLTFADSLSRCRGQPLPEVRRRRPRDPDDHRSAGRHHLQFANLAAFLANTPTTIQYFGDLSEPSPFNNGATGPKHIKQEYYVGVRAGRVARAAELHAELRPPLRLLRAAAARPTTGSSSSTSRPGARSATRRRFYQSKKNNFQPRVSATFSPTSKTVLRGGVGIFVGPGRPKIRFSRSKPSASARR